MRLALLTTDNREHLRDYHLKEPRFGPAIEALVEGLATVPDLETHIVTCTQRPMASPARLAEQVHFHSLLVPKFGWLRTGYQGCIRAIRRKLRELRPDVVHGQGTERECALGAVFSGFPNVVTIHGNMNQVARAMNAKAGDYFWCAALLERLALPRTGGVFCNSAYTESVVQRFTRRTWRVPNAVRSIFLETPTERTEAKIPRLLNIGVIAPYKRQHDLLDMAERLHREGYAFQLDFLGAVDLSMAYAARFIDRVNAAQSHGFVRHLGTRSARELVRELDAASALVHVPSEEAFGLVVAEALSRNLKFFGAEVGGVPDIARGVEGAELFGAGDFDALGCGIAEWLRGGAKRPRGAASVMRERYQPEVIAGRHREIYAELLSAPKRR